MSSRNKICSACGLSCLAHLEQPCGKGLLVPTVEHVQACQRLAWPSHTCHANFDRWCKHTQNRWSFHAFSNMQPKHHCMLLATCNREGYCMLSATCNRTDPSMLSAAHQQASIFELQADIIGIHTTLLLDDYRIQQSLAAYLHMQ